MATKKPKTTKPLRSREYTGPNTVEGVKAYLQTNAYAKAKEKAVAALSQEDQIRLFEEIRKQTLDAARILEKQYDELAKARGFKVSGK